MKPSETHEPRSQNKNVRELVTELKRLGIVFEGFRNKHPYYVDPATGRGREVPLSPSRRYWRVHDTKLWCDILDTRASERLKNWAHLTRRSLKETPASGRTSRIADVLADHRPAPVLFLPPVANRRHRALTRLAALLAARHDYAALRLVHEELERVETRCAVGGCPTRFTCGRDRLCAMHADDDAFTDVNFRFYRQLMEAA